MLLTHPLRDPVLNLTLEVFLRDLHALLGARLLSVVLYGSVTFGDLAPGCGDLDFLAVADGDLSEDDRRALVALRRPLREGRYGILARMLEGAFLPRPMLDPAVPGQALWWGTSGERPWERNGLGWLVLHVIRERGIPIYGADLRAEIPPAQEADLVEDVWAAVRSAREHGRGSDDVHTVDWLLTAARLLLWVREGRLSSKTEAADWGAVHARGAWRAALPRAQCVRRNPPMAARSDVRAWLQTLGEPIQQAYDELEAALRSGSWVDRSTEQ